MRSCLGSIIAAFILVVLLFNYQKIYDICVAAIDKTYTIMVTDNKTEQTDSIKQ